MWDKAIHVAAGRGHLPELDHYLTVDPAMHINARGFNKMTPLMCAAFRGQEAAVSRLLAFGSSPLEVDASQWTALHHASFKGHVGVIHLLLSQGHHVDPVNADGSTPLHVAMAAGKTQAVRALLHLGANASLRDHKGRTPGDLRPHKDLNVHEMLQMASYQSYALQKLWSMNAAPPLPLTQQEDMDSAMDLDDEEEEGNGGPFPPPPPPTLYEVHRDSEDYPMTAHVLHWTLTSMKPDTFRELCMYLF